MNVLDFYMLLNIKDFNLYIPNLNNNYSDLYIYII